MCEISGVRNLDVRNMDVRKMDVRDLGVRNLGVRNMDVRDLDVRKMVVRNLDVRNMDVRDLDVRKMDVRGFICMYFLMNLFRTSQKIYNFKRQGFPVLILPHILLSRVRKTGALNLTTWQYKINVHFLTNFTP